MAQIYTSQDLAQILAREREACLRGDRLSLTASTTRFNPIVEPFVNAEGVQKFTAFCDFRDAVHDYQRTHQVSGLLWRRFTVKGLSIEYPEVDEHLIALPQDLEILALHKPPVLDFWRRIAQGMETYCHQGKHSPHSPVSSSEIELQSQRAEWAYLHKLEYPGALEITLQLGWGCPKEASYQKHWPLSGCCFIHAVEPGRVPQSAYY
ncbi:hypothetical protein [Altericista sp. CCNU0014]|uniref:hypothetical protein n=1 Tax=Altericista sp. CCNU0014 TaxID=3082949 RepID=UPI00384AA431